MQDMHYNAENFSVGAASSVNSTAATVRASNVSNLDIPAETTARPTPHRPAFGSSSYSASITRVLEQFPGAALPSHRPPPPTPAAKETNNKPSAMKLAFEQFPGAVASSERVPAPNTQAANEPAGPRCPLAEEVSDPTFVYRITGIRMSGMSNSLSGTEQFESNPDDPSSGLTFSSTRSTSFFTALLIPAACASMILLREDDHPMADGDRRCTNCGSVQRWTKCGSATNTSVKLPDNENQTTANVDGSGELFQRPPLIRAYGQRFLIVDREPPSLSHVVAQPVAVAVQSISLMESASSSHHDGIASSPTFEEETQGQEGEEDENDEVRYHSKEEPAIIEDPALLAEVGDGEGNNVPHDNPTSTDEAESGLRGDNALSIETREAVVADRREGKGRESQGSAMQPREAVEACRLGGEEATDSVRKRVTADDVEAKRMEDERVAAREAEKEVELGRLARRAEDGRRLRRARLRRQRRWQPLNKSQQLEIFTIEEAQEEADTSYQVAEDARRMASVTIENTEGITKARESVKDYEDRLAGFNSFLKRGFSDLSWASKDEGLESESTKYSTKSKNSDAEMILEEENERLRTSLEDAKAVNMYYEQQLMELGAKNEEADQTCRALQQKVDMLMNALQKLEDQECSARLSSEGSADEHPLTERVSADEYDSKDNFDARITRTSIVYEALKERLDPVLYHSLREKLLHHSRRRDEGS